MIQWLDWPVLGYLKLTSARLRDSNLFKGNEASPVMKKARKKADDEEPGGYLFAKGVKI